MLGCTEINPQQSVSSVLFLVIRFNLFIHFLSFFDERHGNVVYFFSASYSVFEKSFFERRRDKIWLAPPPRHRWIYANGVLTDCWLKRAITGNFECVWARACVRAPRVPLHFNEPPWILVSSAYTGLCVTGTANSLSQATLSAGEHSHCIVLRSPLQPTSSTTFPQGWGTHPSQ